MESKHIARPHAYDRLQAYSTVRAVMARSVKRISVILGETLYCVDSVRTSEQRLACHAYTT